MVRIHRWLCVLPATFRAGWLPPRAKGMTRGMTPLLGKEYGHCDFVFSWRLAPFVKEVAHCDFVSWWKEVKYYKTSDFEGAFQGRF
eukprot:2999294-Amphidinium_carterae.2